MRPISDSDRRCLDAFDASPASAAYRHLNDRSRATYARAWFLKVTDPKPKPAPIPTVIDFRPFMFSPVCFPLLLPVARYYT